MVWFVRKLKELKSTCSSSCKRSKRPYIHEHIRQGCDFDPILKKRFANLDDDMMGSHTSSSSFGFFRRRSCFLSPHSCFLSLSDANTT